MRDKRRLNNTQGQIRLRRIALQTASLCLATLLLTFAGIAGASTPAKQASRVYLVEVGQLHLISEGEATLNERGRAKGTFNAPVTSQLKLSPGHVTAAFTVYAKGGSVSGEAHALFEVRNSIGYYGGTLTIMSGTGTYRHAAGSNIGFSGTINRLSFALTVKVHGWISL